MAAATEHGAGSVLALALIGSIVTLALAALGLAAALVQHQRIEGAADNAAIAAADVARGLLPGIPCERAATVARANGGQLAECALDGYIVTVTVGADVLGVRATARATAGPPP